MICYTLAFTGTLDAYLCDNLLLAEDAVLLLEFLDQRLVDLAVHGSENTLLGQSSVQDLLDSDRAWDADELGHGRVAAGVGATVLDKSRSSRLFGSVLQLDLELVLQDDDITLSLTVLHLLLERGAEGIQGVSTGDGLLVREETEPSEATQDVVALLVILEVCLGGDGVDESLLIRRRSTDDSLGSLLPGDRVLAAALLLVAQETNVDKDLDEFREAGVSQSTADDSLGLGDVVTLLVRGRISVGVRNGSESFSYY